MAPRGTITFVPSVHFSPAHRRRVRATIREVDPDVVAVELDERRFERLTRRARLDHRELARELPPATAATYRTLRAIQRTVARLYGLDPGQTDMEAAIETAAELGVDVALIDEPVEAVFAAIADRVGVETVPKMLLRSQFLGPRERFGQFQPFLLPFTGVESGDDVQPTVDYLRRVLPEVTDVLIDQRDRMMARRLHALRCRGTDVVVVIGAAHHNGIRRTLEELEASGPLPDVSVPLRRPNRESTEIPIE